MRADPVEVQGLIDVWEYRGVRFDHRPGSNEWVTWSQIIGSVRMSGGREIRGTSRISARSKQQLLRKIDKHIDAGGQIATA